jgi:hypothetical protein
MGLDMNLHKALDKLADGTEHRTEAEERDLGELLDDEEGYGLSPLSGIGENMAELLYAR